MINQALASPICWAIVAVALFTYQQLFAGYFHLRQQPASPLDHSLTTVCIAAMPLLGLLGTIVGLLACFKEMALGASSGNPLSGGIADALLTTQLGLVCALPGWLLQAHLHATEHHQLALLTQHHQALLTQRHQVLLTEHQPTLLTEHLQEWLGEPHKSNAARNTAAPSTTMAVA